MISCEVTSVQALLPPSVNSVSCRVKDIIHVKITAVSSYNPPKLLDSCLQETKFQMGNCYVISNDIYIHIYLTVE